MNLRELSIYLEEECYQPLIYHVGPDWHSCGDACCLDRVGNRFEIFYVERGQRGDPIHCFESENEVCGAFLACLDRERFSRAHCVGSFADRAAADSLSDKLTNERITVHRNVISYGGPRYRVFVFGRDKLRVGKLSR